MIINTPISGGYGCVDTRGFIGEEIRIFTRSHYSHSFMILNAAEGTILEAQPKGSKISNIHEYDGLDMIFSTDAVLGGNVTALMQAAQMFTGIPYGFLDIAYLGLELATGWQWKWLLDRVLSEDRMICSQLVAAFGVKYMANSWKCGQEYAQLVTPGMLATRAL